MDGGLITVSLFLPAQARRLPRRSRSSRRPEQAIEKIPDVKTVLAAVGDQGSQTVLSLVQLLGAHEASLTLVLAPRPSQRCRPTRLRTRFHEFASTRTSASAVHADRTAAALGDDYFPGVTLHLTSPDLDSLRSASETTSPVRSVGLSKVATSLGDPQPELLRVTDRSFQGILAGGEQARRRASGPCAPQSHDGDGCDPHRA